ncbi:hypothetical protein N7468_010223 [Penicillium chermesinum]|uniref:N-acetyltransferase domain-containing protein n=1 Tax=Penicillium chermesinum TaxID=63820 RepID=A0A9W9NC95_9EURO|nr:uncharacterized protein N7468_010223 [Penicillium chermesinum]KAJ5217215.1 hypothetical protein N7468_010223 [Penicillium chermesinum]
MPSVVPFTQSPALSGKDPLLRPLTPADVKSCTVVERAFPEHEQCSEEKFIYRLNQTPELCLGLFIWEEGKEQLIGHIIGMRVPTKEITEGSMHMPENWRERPSDQAYIVDGQLIGNDPHGKTIAIHSVVISPQYQGNGVGKALVKAYIEFIKETQVDTDGIVLIAHDYLIKFYEGAGFVNHGLSACRFAGETWYDLVLDL